MGTTIATILFLLPLLTYNVVNTQGQTIYDITDAKYGAKPGADISPALLKAWTEAAASTTPSKVVVPQGEWYLSQVKLVNNKAPLELEIKGTIKADAEFNKLPNNEGEWITINYVNYFTLSGGGVLDGQGQNAWKQNGCAQGKCKKTPMNLSLNFLNNSIIKDFTSKDSKNWHMNCISSHNVTFDKITISAPGDSPNTDGIHIARSSLITVTNSKIGTGDDCISIGDQMSELHISNVVCGPGHGISVGSMGRSTTEKDVKGVYVKNCTFINTDNGVRVKTWPSAPATLVISDIVFEDLIMDNVKSPVILDQMYCPRSLCDTTKPSLIHITNVTVNNIKGTYQSDEGVTFACSGAKPCNVTVGNIDLAFVGKTPAAANSKCEFVYPILKGKQNPPVCAGTPVGAMSAPAAAGGAKSAPGGAKSA